MTYEDELPKNITDEEYSIWLDRSTVDGVRIGPSIEFVRSLIAIRAMFFMKAADANRYEFSRIESEALSGCCQNLPIDTVT